jgi:hypothetical protein
VSREDALKTEVGLLEEEYEGAQNALRNCLTAAWQADPTLAGRLGSTAALLTVAAAARVLWYQVHGLEGPIFPLGR